MTRNDLTVSARRLANDAEQLRGRQRSLTKLSQGRLHDKWRPEYRALEQVIEMLETQVETLRRKADEMANRETA